MILCRWLSLCSASVLFGHQLHHTAALISSLLTSEELLTAGAESAEAAAAAQSCVRQLSKFALFKPILAAMGAEASRNAELLDNHVALRRAQQEAERLRQLEQRACALLGPSPLASLLHDPSAVMVDPAGAGPAASAAACAAAGAETAAAETAAAAPSAARSLVRSLRARVGALVGRQLRRANRSGDDEQCERLERLYAQLAADSADSPSGGHGPSPSGADGQRPLSRADQELIAKFSSGSAHARTARTLTHARGAAAREWG